MKAAICGNYKQTDNFKWKIGLKTNIVPLQGLEPRQAEPESEVLPLHHKGI